MADQNPYNPNATWTGKGKKYVYEPKSRTPPSEKKPVVSRPRGDDHIVPRSGDGQGGGAKKIVIASAIIVGVIVLAAVAYFILKPAPALSVAITFTKPDQAQIGDPFPFSISYNNTSGDTLTGAKLSLTLPDGVLFAGNGSGTRVMEWPVGDIAPSGIGNQSSTLIVTGNPASVEHLSAVLTYDPDSSGNAQFQTSAVTDIVVGSPAVGLTITAPADVSSGQNFRVTVAYVNNAGHALGDVRVNLQYPPAFTFGGSTVSPDLPLNNEWDLGSLASGASGSFTITGVIIGPDNTSYTITGTANTDVAGKNYAITSQTATLVIAPSSLKFAMDLNSTQNYVAGLADSLIYTLSYANNSDVTLQNVTITAKFVGAIFDFSTLRSPGSFNSVTDVLTWSGANTPELLTLSPGQSGTVQVTMRTKNSFPIRLLSDKNYSLKVHAQIMSPTVPSGVAASSTVAVVDLLNKVGGLTTFTSAGFSKDPNSTITNTGPYPPKVDQPTQYTIHWRITNYSTDIASVTVSAYLQSGTTCTGQLESNVSGSLPNCDPATGLVSWNIPSIPATTGVISPPAEAVFQVVNTPSINQAGQNATLLGPATFQAKDLYTGTTIQVTAPAVDTSLPEDKTQISGTRQVTN